MGISGNKISVPETPIDYDRLKELKVFDESKAGVKGIVDAGILNVPKMFIRPADGLANELNSHPTQLKVPTVDLNRLESGYRRRVVVDEIRQASEKWGFFQVVNHGIPVSSLNRMIDGVRAFHEQDVEVKKECYTLDSSKMVRYRSNPDLYYLKAANWRDTLNVNMLTSYDQVPAACRDETIEYSKHVTKLGDTLFELLSEALGLEPGHLKGLECGQGRSIGGHYYPACPEPELTLGTSKHSDPVFLTVLLQDHIGGLQVLHENQWINVPPIAGALVVNIGDHLQMISNNKFKSVDHRVLANRIGPRISVAFFFTGVTAPAKIYGPIKELISKESPPVYKDFTIRDYMMSFRNRPVEENKCVLQLFKI